jgi:hypothetical protein
MEGRDGVDKQDAKGIRKPESLWKAEDKICFTREEVRRQPLQPFPRPTNRLSRDNRLAMPMAMLPPMVNRSWAWAKSHRVAACDLAMADIHSKHNIPFNPMFPLVSFVNVNHSQTILVHTQIIYI